MPPPLWFAQQPPKSPNLPFKKIIYRTVAKGALVNFNYMYWKHDPYPLVIVTDVFQDRIRGVNLHYLTYRYMKGLLGNFCGKQDFSYRYIKHDKFIVNAFRTYKKQGIRQLKMLDCDVINSALMQVRSFNPKELEAIRQSIEKQLRTQLNPTAEQMAKQYKQEIITPQGEKGFMPLGRPQRQDARRAFRPSQEGPLPPSKSGPMIPPPAV